MNLEGEPRRYCRKCLLREMESEYFESLQNYPILENYRVFSMKVYLTHKVMLDVYRQVLAADKLNYKPLHCGEDMLEKHEIQVEEFEKTIALDYSQKIVGKFDEYDASYQTIWGKEMELMRHLKSYVAEMQKNIYFVRFGRKR